MFDEVAKGAKRIAERVVVAGGIGLSTLSPTSVLAQNAPTANSDVPREICHAAQMVFSDYVKANINHFSTTDREQLSILNQWFGAGCQGTVRLKAGLPEVWATTTHIQTRIGKDRYDFGRVISLVP